jgi:hypothetical protein
MYTLTFLVVFPLLLISAGLFIFSLIQLSRDKPNARAIMTSGYLVWLVSIITGALVFLFA